MLSLIVLHGMSCYLEECWLPKLIENANKLEISEIIVPHFPLLKDITYEKWENIFSKSLNKINENTIIIAHSLSTLFIIRFIFKFGLSFKALICIGGGYTKKITEEYKHLVDFLPNEKEFNFAKNHIKNRFHIFSDNDTIWTQQQIKKYNEFLHPVQIKTHNCGHYGRQSQIKEIKELNLILKSLIKA